MDYQTKECKCDHCGSDRTHLASWLGLLCMTCGTRHGSPKSAKRIIAENGTDGYNCEKCKNFCAYVEPNQLNGGYVCPDCRGVGNLT